MKIKVTQKQRDNALFAYNVMWPSVPQKNVVPALAFWRGRVINGATVASYFLGPEEKKIVDCGTVACFGGWVAVNPYFKAQGVRAAKYDGAPLIPMRGIEYPSDVAKKLFGDSGLFCAKSGGEPADPHKAVSARLRKLILNSEVVK